MSNANMPKHPEKKTERLDVRLSHEKKQAFALACENQSDTPSQAVRRFINSYIRRSNRDDIEAALRTAPKTRAFIILGVVVSLIAMAFFTPAFLDEKTTKMPLNELFNFYDSDESGILELTEISANDHHLHRVLNINGIAGISSEEFISHGTMVWKFIIPENWDIIEDTKSGLKHKRTLMKFPKLPEGSLIPTGDPGRPFLTVEEYKAEVLGKSISEIQQISNFDSRKFREIETDAPLVNARNFVIFDIRDPKAIQIDVLEQKSKSRFSKSLVFSRSVEWVQDSEIPHFVMGQGSEQWKSMTP